MKIAALVAAMGLAAVANAQIVFTGSPVSQNFDGLPSAAVTGVISATIGAQASLTSQGALGWSAAKNAGTGSAALPLAFDNGSSNSGGVFNYGLTGSTDRALGLLASGGFIGTIGAEIVNNAPNAIDSFTVSFSAEEYRKSNGTGTGTSAPVLNVLAFAFGVSGGTATSSNYLTDSSLTPVPAGNVVSTTPTSATAAASIAVFTALGTVNVTVSGLNVAPGQSIFLRWTDTNDIGNDAGLAIDDFNFSATVIPTPGSAALVTIGGLVAARRRRA